MIAKPFCDGPFRAIKGSGWIVGKDKHGDDCHVLDQRGWGYLTGFGHSALGLDTATASQMQADMQQWVVDALNAAWNRRADLAQTDPRDEVIKGLVEALGECRQAITDYMNQYPHMAKGYLVDAEQHARTALAAAKAVQHD